MSAPRPIVWSIAGLDTAGGAGLSADQRAADAMGVHLCPVLACLTAQNSLGVCALFPVPADALEAQLAALAQDLPPRAIKTGLLGSVAAIEAVARWVDHFRAQAPAGVNPHQHLALVVDPVLKASAGGAAFSHEAIVQAYREHLLPRATVITPNRAEARALRGVHDAPTTTSLPSLARALQTQGAQAVFITGGDQDAGPHPTDAHVADHDPGHSIDWLQSPHAQGWLTAPRVSTPHHHGTGCTLATGIAAALALGHVPADACVLGKMLTHHALMHSHAAGQGAGPVSARPGFAAGPAHGGAPLPLLGLGEALPWVLTHSATGCAIFQRFEAPANGLYGIVATAAQLAMALDAGMACMQLRHKPAHSLSEHLAASLALAQRPGVQVFINDHWQAALDAIEHFDGAGKVGLHLGQEDLLALSPSEQARLLQARSRVMLGLSSHSLWELARAAGCGASYIACGPVQATTTKDMPWRPQGTHNLRWWVAHSPVPVVGIGGLLTPQDLARFAPCGAATLCVVRGLGDSLADMQTKVPALQSAIAARPAPLDAPSEWLERAHALQLPLPKPVLPTTVLP